MQIKRYLRLLVLSSLSMMAGSQMVHNYYQPLTDLEDYVQREIERRKANT